MPVHDWSCIAAGNFHHFHHSWIEEIQRALNSGLLPDDYDALAEQRTAGYGPDVLALQVDAGDDTLFDAPVTRNGGSMVAKSQVAVTVETDMEFYRRKQNVVAVHHVRDDRVVAASGNCFTGEQVEPRSTALVRRKIGPQLLDQRIHLLILDLHPPGSFDPQGIHGAIWEEIAGTWIAKAWHDVCPS